MSVKMHGLVMTIALLSLVRAQPDCPFDGEFNPQLISDIGKNQIAMRFTYGNESTTITQCRKFSGSECTDRVTLTARTATRCGLVDKGESEEGSETGMTLLLPENWFSNISIAHAPAFFKIGTTESPLELHLGMLGETVGSKNFITLVIQFPLGSASAAVKQFITDAKSNRLDFSAVLDPETAKLYSVQGKDVPGNACPQFSWVLVQSKFTVSKEQAAELTEGLKPNLDVCKSRLALVPEDNKAIREGAASPTPASPRPEGAPDPNEDAPVPTSTQEPVCFPETAQVQLESGNHIPISQLNIGDRVVVRNGKVSPVFLFSHRDPHAVTSHVKLALESGKSITLSPGHFVYVNDSIKPARDVRPGDTMRNSSGHIETVTSSTLVHARGLYNPQTLEGTIIVDGLLCSTYTEAIERPAAHAMLAPLRSMFRLGGVTERSAGQFLAKGTNVW